MDEVPEMFADARQALDIAEDNVEKGRFDQALVELQTVRMRMEDVKDAIETRNAE